MSEKKRNILLSIFLSLLIVTLMSFSLTQARYSKEPESGSDISGDIDFVVSQSIVIESVDDFFTAIENGYTNIQISDEVDNPLVISGGVADVNSDLTIDLNGHEIQRNNREPMLDIQEGVRLTITDSKGGGGFYNPVGSVLRISGGTLTVTNGLFESGPRNGQSLAASAVPGGEYAEEYGNGYMTPAGASASGSESVTYYQKSGASYTAGISASMPILEPHVEKSKVNEGRFVVNGNMYFENKAMVGGYTICAETYLYYTLEGDNIDNTTIATDGSADFYYEYYVTQDEDTGKVAYLRGQDSAADGAILVTVYGYKNAKGAANPEDGTEIPDYAAIQMQSGNIYVRGGRYTSYFGENNTYCVYATGGNMAVENGTFEAHGNGTCVNMAIINAGGAGESEESLRIAHGSFYSQVGNTIGVAAGNMRVTGGSFHKDASAGAGGTAGANNAIISISGGSLVVAGTADGKVTFDLKGSYMYGIESSAESRVGAAATRADAGQVTVTNANFTFNGGSNAGGKTAYTTNYGIYAQTGMVTANGCVFRLPDVNSRGISVESGTVNVGGAGGSAPSSGLDTHTYSYFYIDESLGGFGVYADTEQQNGSSNTSASSENVAVNIGAAQIFVGQSKTVDPTDTDISYNFVNGAGVYMNAGGENSEITLGNVLIIASGNCTSGIYVANGKVTQKSDKKLVVITGAVADGYISGGTEFRDIDDESNYGVTVKNDVRSITDLIAEGRIVNKGVQYTYGVYGGGGTVTLGNVYAAVYGTKAAGILTEHENSSVAVNGTLAMRAEGPQGTSITVSGISTESGDITLAKGADIEVGYGLGITARGGSVTFANGEVGSENLVNITTKNATAVYINNGTLTIGTVVEQDGQTAGQGDYITANIVSTITEGASWTTPPSGTQGKVSNQFDGVYVQGGSLMSYGTFNVTHKGVANDDQYNNNGATLYQTFVTKSFAVRVETSSAKDTEVEIRQGTIQSVVEGTGDSQAGGGGGLYVGYPADSTVGKAKVTLGRTLAENESAPNLTIQSFGSDIIDTDIAYQDKTNWEYRQSRTGGSAVEVNGGTLDIYYGNYSAAMGDGIKVKNGTVNIYNGTFIGADSYAPPQAGGIMAGVAASYGFKLYGGTVNIYDGTFGDPNATGLAAGSGAFVMGTAASSKAKAYIYGGTFEVAGQAGFSIYQYVDVWFDEYGGEGDAGSEIYAKGFEAGMTVEYNVNSDNNTTITVKDGTFEGSSDNFSNGIWYGEATSQLMIEDGDFIGEATSGLYFYTAPGTNRSPSNVQLYGGRYWGSPQSDSYMRDEWYYQGAIGNPNSRGSFLGIPTGYNGLEIPLSSIIASGKNVYDASGVQIYSGSNGDSIRYNVSSQSYVTIR